MGTSASAPPAALDARDLLLTALLVITAACLRFWNLQTLGLTHFDEGSYALAARWLVTGGVEGHPPEPAQAPLLVPALAALFFAVFGVHDYVAVAVSAAAGSLLVGLSYLIGTKWFSRTTGIGAALFLAVAEYDLMYSRMFLTDETFSLLFWACLLVLIDAVKTGGRAWLGLGGLLSALCWNTKYHGFFPLVIVGLWLTVEHRQTVLFATKYRRLFGVATLAVLGFAPWIVAVALTTGWSEIVAGLWQHSLGGGIPRTSPETLAFYLGRWLSPPLLVLAVPGLVVALADRNHGGRFIVLTLAFFFISALFYSSFPRLVLPLVPGLCLLASRGAEWLSSATPAPGLWRWKTAILWILVLGWSARSAGGVLGMRTDSYRLAARYLQDIDEPVLSQMSKNFYFYEDAGTLEMRRRSVADLDRILTDSPSVVIAIDPVLYKMPGYLTWLESRRAQLQLLKTFELRVYEPLYYQGFDPRSGLENLPRAIAPLVPGDARIDVYRIRR